MSGYNTAQSLVAGNSFPSLSIVKTGLLVSIIIANTSRAVAQASATVSIKGAPGFSEQRGCVQYYLDSQGLDIDYFLDCEHLNSCYCRGDLYPAITGYLSSKLSSSCTPGPATSDISAAISIYNAYCSTALADPATNAAPAASTSTAMAGAGTSQAPATTSNNGSPLPSTTYEVATVTSNGQSPPSLSSTIPTSTRSGNGVLTIRSTITVTPSKAATNSGGHSGLDGGQIAGIVIAVVGLLLTALGVYFAYKTNLFYKKKRKPQPVNTPELVQFR